ncbi:hypothetical protein CHUAL_003551 [Chamberlinius hualienensis]
MCNKEIPRAERTLDGLDLSSLSAGLGIGSGSGSSFPSGSTTIESFINVIQNLINNPAVRNCRIYDRSNEEDGFGVTDILKTFSAGFGIAPLNGTFVELLSTFTSNSIIIDIFAKVISAISG